VSTAAPALTAGDLVRIGEASASRNQALGLTGLLIHQDQTFLGVLEGGRRRLFSRMEAIIVDPRHNGVSILREEEAGDRRFQNWHFTSVPVDGSLKPFDLAGTFIRTIRRARHI